MVKPEVQLKDSKKRYNLSLNTAENHGGQIGLIGLPYRTSPSRKIAVKLDILTANELQLHKRW